MRSLFFFWREALRSPVSTGAVGPSSPSVARAMTAPLANRKGPRTVLEVGPGTGALTEAIVECLGPQDNLDLCEINPRFASWLRKRFVGSHRNGPSLRVFEGDVLEVVSGPYDFIISSVPCSNLSPDAVRKLLEGLLARLAPDGVLSCLHYRGQGLRSRLARGAERERLKRVMAITKSFQRSFGLGKEPVWLNIPPAEIHYLGREPATCALDFLEPPRRKSKVHRVTRKLFPIGSTSK
jgi:phospholipid N-methyltransferase